MLAVGPGEYMFSKSVFDVVVVIKYLHAARERTNYTALRAGSVKTFDGVLLIASVCVQTRLVVTELVLCHNSDTKPNSNGDPIVMYEFQMQHRPSQI